MNCGIIAVSMGIILSTMGYFLSTTQKYNGQKIEHNRLGPTVRSPLINAIHSSYTSACTL